MSETKMNPFHHTNSIATIKRCRNRRIVAGLLSILRLAIVVAGAVGMLYLMSLIPSVGERGSEWKSGSYYEVNQ